MITAPAVPYLNLNISALTDRVNMEAVLALGRQKSSPEAGPGASQRLGRFLRQHPKVTDRCEGGRTLLHYACILGHADMVALLLRVPGVEVNARVDLETPLIFAAHYSNADCVRLLLEDPTVDVSLRSNQRWHHGYETALERAIACEVTDCIKWFLALRSPAENAIGRMHLSRIAASSMRPLLQEYANNPVPVRLRLQFELGIVSAAIVFSIVLLVSDDFFRIKSLPEMNDDLHDEGIKAQYVNAIRLLTISSKLPIELQMLLAHRAMGSAGDIVLQKEFDPAITHLLK